MAAAVFFLALLSMAFAQVGDEILEGYSDSSILQILAEETNRKILETSAELDRAPQEYVNISSSRLKSLLWECLKQKDAVNQTLISLVFRGMQKNKQFNAFQCVSIKGQQTFEKLTAIESRIPDDTKDLINKGLAETMSFKLILTAFSEYVKDLYEKKSEEMKKADSDSARKKITEEFTQKMKLLATVLEQMQKRVKDAKFKFFEDYINYAFSTENSLRNIQREGVEKIKKCMA